MGSGCLGPDVANMDGLGRSFRLKVAHVLTDQSHRGLDDQCHGGAGPQWEAGMADHSRMGRLTRGAFGGLIVAGLAISALSSAGASTTTVSTGQAAGGTAGSTTTSLGKPAKVGPTTTTTSKPTASSTPTTAPPPSVPPRPFCDVLEERLDGLRHMSLSLTDPQQLRALVEDAGQGFAQALPSAQSDVRPDMGVLAATIADYRSALDNAGYDVTKLAPDMVTKLQSPPVVKAMSRLDDWAKRAC